MPIPRASDLQETPHDVHSYARPDEVRVRDVRASWDVDFEKRELAGMVVLDLARKPHASELVLDTRDLIIDDVHGIEHDQELDPGESPTLPRLPYTLGEADPILGTPLTIALGPDDNSVLIRYRTSPKATGLQWLTPEQTAGKRHPFMFSQAQAIHARSFLPCQDSPGVRVTYSASVTAPEGLDVLMSAKKVSTEGNVHRFEMKQPIPPYLIAIAVGDLAFRELGPRSGVYAEPSVVEKAAYEFADLEQMITATEDLYGPYRWERYDVLVLPPSFPFGGMENPRMTFATPTILAGDRSLVSLVAHELAHSWSGNLVTNATWSDFWLNEGFTVYLERRIQEKVYGVERARMEGFLGRQDLDATLAEFAEKPGEQILHIDLEGRDPDDGMTDVPYEKGALFLIRLEQAFGREAFDAFLRSYFDAHAFQSIETKTFEQYLQQHLFAEHPEIANTIDVRAWIHEPGLPPDAPTWTSEALDRAEALAQSWIASETETDQVRADTRDWNTQQWLRFLRALPNDLGPERLGALDEALGLTVHGNAEITMQWLLVALRNGYRAADARLEAFLLGQGRRKLVKPLFEELARTDEGKARALAIYAKARPLYHSITSSTIDVILGL